MTPWETFEQARPRMLRLAERFVDDPTGVVEEASRRFARMVPDLGYLDRPEHPLAHALFVSAVNLALYLALHERGVDVHAFGRALLTGLSRAPLPAPPEVDAAMRARQLEAFEMEAAASQREPRPGEDIVEYVASDGDSFEFGYDVKSCAACTLAGKHDAMAAVPYLCAVDDVLSDKWQQGLRRTGSIALGASHCDFRYRAGGEPRRLAAQYPDRIRIEGVD